jgi:WD40 repeat protein
MPAPLLDTIGKSRALDAFVNGVAWIGDRALFTLGDGAVIALDVTGSTQWRTQAHAGAVLSQCLSGATLLTGGDDGRVCALDTDGALSERAKLGNGWVEAIATNGKLIAAAMGNAVHVIAADGAVTVFDHPSTVTGVAFAKSGRRIAASHYGGVTVSWAAAPQSKRKSLEWKGAHTSVLWSHDSKFIVTAMMENALHGWRLQDGQHFRIAGYPAKIRSMDFTPDGKWLATAGAEEVVLWPFQSANGPINTHASVAGELQAPAAMIACHPARPALAAASADGEVALMPIAGGKPVLVANPSGARITALAWSEDGRFLAYGDEEGRAAVLDFTEALG